MSYPKTREEYWQLAEDNKGLLQDLIATYHPYYRNAHLDHSISAPTAERACEVFRKQIAEGYAEDIPLFGKDINDPQALFRKYLEEKDPEIATLLNEVWFGMPESYASREAPGFGVLCDLCSEAYLLYDEETPDYDNSTS